MLTSQGMASPFKTTQWIHMLLDRVSYDKEIQVWWDKGQIINVAILKKPKKEFNILFNDIIYKATSKALDTKHSHSFLSQHYSTWECRKRRRTRICQSGRWGLKNHHCGPLCLSIFNNSKEKTLAKHLFSLLLRGSTIAIISHEPGQHIFLSLGPWPHSKCHWRNPRKKKL